MNMDKRSLVASLPRSLLNFFRRYPPSTAVVSNPFLPTHDATTGKYHKPRYSARRQNGLYKSAYEWNLHDYLPAGSYPKELATTSLPKAPMKGTQRWKGTKAERTFDERTELIEDKFIRASRAMSRRKAQRRRAWKVLDSIR
ncbi:hypothetical protein PYCC9005_000265 [Savitreella phatthalungensis]